MLTRLYNLKCLHDRCQKLITHVVLAQFCKTVYEKYDRQVLKIKAHRHRVFSAIKIMSCLKSIIKKRGSTMHDREIRIIKNSLFMVNQVKKDRALTKAQECFLWFMRESAYQNLKITKFKKMIKHVIDFQRTYRGIKMRRIIRRTLMDKTWEKFVEEQKKLATRAEMNAKRK